jgi:hypothetical protein
MIEQSKSRKPKIEKLEAPPRELTQEEAEAAQGGKKSAQQIKTEEAKIEALLQELQGPH